MNKTTPSLPRSIPFWTLFLASIASLGAGGWTVWSHASTMEATLLDGTATNVEVYVGQAWVTAGAALLAAGVIGVLLLLALTTMVTMRAKPVPSDRDDLEPAEHEDPSAARPSTTAPGESASDELSPDDQNGSSGSTATATKISVR